MHEHIRGMEPVHIMLQVQMWVGVRIMGQTRQVSVLSEDDLTLLTS